METLFQLKSSLAVVIYTEPLWGIPYFLFTAYASLYMLALGLSERQIGLVITFDLICQVFFTLISAAVTDKLGQRKATFIFDMLSWGMCTLLWSMAQNMAFFLVAAFFHSTLKVTVNAWNLLITEDAPGTRLFIYIQCVKLPCFFPASLPPWPVF